MSLHREPHSDGTMQGKDPRAVLEPGIAFAVQAARAQAAKPCSREVRIALLEFANKLEAKP
jgi:hypothetical protein